MPCHDSCMLLQLTKFNSMHRQFQFTLQGRHTYSGQHVRLCQYSEIDCGASFVLYMLHNNCCDVVSEVSLAIVLAVGM